MLQLGEKYGFEVSDCDGHAGEICWGGFSENSRDSEIDKACESEDLDIGQRCDSKNSDVGIWGHLDVVPEGEGWNYPPFEMTREDDFLIGRGTQDNKGPLIAALYAMRFLKESGWKLQKRYRLIFGCDEERGMNDVKYFLEHRNAPAYSFVADCGFPVCRGEKGMLHLKLEKEIPVGMIRSLKSGTVLNSVPGTAQAELFGNPDHKEHTYTVSADGISGHAAFPEGTVHAAGKLCERLFELTDGECAEIGEQEKAGCENSGERMQEDERSWLTFLQQLCSDGFGTGLGIACEDEESGRLTCNAGLIDWESGRCSIDLDIRYPVTVCAQDLLKRVEKTACEYGFVWKVLKLGEPFHVSADHPLVKCLMEVYDREVGDKKPAYIMGGGTYAKKIPRTVGFGPGMDQHFERIGFTGSRGSCHSIDEAQSLTNLKMAWKIYVSALLALEAL